MALSPNYSWSEPDNSSLVKNGAADIRTLGDAIDTSVWNVGYGQAAKNKIINGDFNINQRSFTTTTTNTAYGFDRWFLSCVGGTATYSTQSFTLGAAPVAGYEGKSFARLAVTGQSASGDFAALVNRIESVRTFAGNTVTLSFWAKASSGTPKVGCGIQQRFGSGGSSAVNIAAGDVTISASWARYSVTVAIPSISGKTIGTDSADCLSLIMYASAGTGVSALTNIGIQTTTIDFWGVQMEYGSKATPFQTATGTIQGELAACQRYYYRFKSDTANIYVGNGIAFSTTVAYVGIQFPVTMRTRPTALEQTGTAANYATVRANSSVDNCTAVPVYASTTTNQMGWVNLTSANLVSGNTTSIYTQTADAYLGWSAEL